MRPIKFRAWDKEEEFMTFPLTISDIIGGHLDWEDDNPPILMQFTGLLDKNGVEIYEGDIVKYQLVEGFDAESYYQESKKKRELVMEVKFRDGEFWPRPLFNYCDDGFYAERRFDFEVIGNVYENPELIK